MRPFKIGDRVKTKKVPASRGRKISETDPIEPSISEKFGTIVRIVSKVCILKLDFGERGFDFDELLHICSVCGLETCPSIDNGD